MDEPKALSPLTEALVHVYEKDHLEEYGGSEKIRVSRTVSAAAFLLEKVRNSVEFRDEHLVRRAAIERIIRRRLLFNTKGEDIARLLIRELIWAKYLPSGSIPETAVGNIQESIDKYLGLRKELLAHVTAHEHKLYSDWLLEVLSCEIEERLSVTIEREAFINYIYQLMLPTITINGKRDEERNLQVYIAVSKAFAKSDVPLLRYQLLKLYLPGIEQQGDDVIPSLLPKISKIITSIEGQLKHPVGSRLYLYIRKQIPPFLILKDVFDEHKHDVSKILTEREKLKEAVWHICSLRYNETGKRLRRIAIRSVVYILITKMAFAILVEVPADRYLEGSVNAIPLAINVLFPPILMFLITLAVSAPGESNTKRIFSRIVELIKTTPDENSHGKPINFASEKTTLRPLLTFMFTLIYGTAFMATFGAIFVLLDQVHFNVVSKLIFMFFLSVIMFFGFRARQTAREYYYGEREGLLSPIFDFLLIPILRVGQWLSDEVTGGIANIFAFIFDFFLELPLKSMFEILEEWFSFLRNKREEIS